MTYAYLCNGRDQKAIAELDLALAPPEQKQRLIDQQNAQAMSQMMGMGMVGPPPRPPVRKADG